MTKLNIIIIPKHLQSTAALSLCAEGITVAREVYSNKCQT